MADPLDTIIWSTLPIDGCPFSRHNDGVHPPTTDDEMHGLGMPVAVSGIEEDRESVYVRFVCPHCRHVWDMVFDCADGFMAEQFGDRFVPDREKRRSPRRGEVAFPAGPSSKFD